jgi:hypothetical protein
MNHHKNKICCDGPNFANDFATLNQTYLPPIQYEAFTHNHNHCIGPARVNNFATLNQTYLPPDQYEAFSGMTAVDKQIYKLTGMKLSGGVAQQAAMTSATTGKPSNFEMPAASLTGFAPNYENYETGPSPSHSAPHPMLGHKFRGKCYEDCKGASNGDWWAKHGCSNYSQGDKCGGCVGDASVLGPGCRGPTNGKIDGTDCKGAHTQKTCLF